MPKHLTQAELERRLARIARAVLKERSDEVMAIIQRGGDWQGALDEVYATMQSRLLDELAPQLGAGVRDSALALMEREALSLSVDAIGNRASEFASRYTYDLVTGIVDTTRERLGNAMTAYFQDESIDLRALGAKVEAVFGEGRGQMIATTEATRASAQGQVVLTEELREESPNARIAMVWATSEDELVCEICGPLDGKRIEGDVVPPAHPNCRCAVRVVVLDEGDYGNR